MFNNICTGFVVLAVNTGNDLRLGDNQQVVVAFDVLADIGKPLTAVICFFQLMALNKSTHAAIKYMNALLHVLL